MVDGIKAWSGKYFVSEPEHHQEVFDLDQQVYRLLNLGAPQARIEQYINLMNSADGDMNYLSEYDVKAAFEFVDMKKFQSKRSFFDRLFSGPLNYIVSLAEDSFHWDAFLKHVKEMIEWHQEITAKTNAELNSQKQTIEDIYKRTGLLDT